MKITRVEAIPLSLPGPVRHTRYRGLYGTKRSFVIVKISTDEGITGLGECTNLLNWSESQGTTVHIIRDHISRLIIGKDPFNIEEILETMDTLGAAAPSPSYPYAKSAIDTALYDIMGKALDVPVYKLLGGCYRREIPNIPSIALKEPPQMAKMATEYLKKGWKFGIKIKAGINAKQDIQNVKVIREAIGEGPVIISDANQGYTRKMAIQTIKKMDDYGPLIMEQPLPAWDFDGMAMLTKAVDSPIMADESIWSPKDAIRIIKEHAADILHIYDDKAGGLYRSKQIAFIAEAEGISTVVSEEGTGIGTAAAAHLIAGTRNVICGMLLGPVYLKDDIVTEPFRHENGCIKVRDKRGLGVELDEDKLKRYTAYEDYNLGVVK